MTRARLVETREILSSGEIMTASVVAKRLGVSNRSAYRYIATLRKLGCNIQSSTGIGYRMRENRK